MMMVMMMMEVLRLPRRHFIRSEVHKAIHDVEILIYDDDGDDDDGGAASAAAALHPLTMSICPYAHVYPHGHMSTCTRRRARPRCSTSSICPYVHMSTHMAICLPICPCLPTWPYVYLHQAPRAPEMLDELHPWLRARGGKECTHGYQCFDQHRRSCAL